MTEVKYPQLGDRDWLIEHYVNQRMTIPEIHAIVGCRSAKSVRNALARHEIPTRGHVDRGLTDDDYAEWIARGGVDENHPIGPVEHKAAKREMGLSTVSELLVMTDSHDPFYAGTPGDIEKGEWFMRMWTEHGAIGHLRRLHYRLVSSDGVTLWDGRPYVNDEFSFDKLVYAGARSRHLRLVDAVDFTDRRNPAPILNVHPRWDDPEPGARLYLVDFDEWYLPALSHRLNVHPFALPEPHVTGYDYAQADQPVLIEVWIEKSTMADVLEPLCEALGINLVQASGMQSITSSVKLLERCQEQDKPGHVIYISDFDPAGDSMPRSVARQLEFYRQTDYPDVEVSLEPLALTHQQVVDLELPRIPTKEGDTRAPGFEERYGEGAVELDALEALHPGMLADLVREAVAPYQDDDLDDRLTSTWDAARQDAKEAWEQDTADLRAELDKLAAETGDAIEPFQARLTALADEVEQAVGSKRERLQELRQELSRLADEYDPELPDRPEGELYLDDQDPLFDSERHWLDQLNRYHRDRGGDGS